MSDNEARNNRTKVTRPFGGGGGGEGGCIKIVWGQDLHLIVPQEVINTGLFHMKSTCRRCHGQGKIITTPCKECGGTGTTIRTQTINVQVPAGSTSPESNSQTP